MSRISTNILIILVLINGSIGIMDASGLSEDTGVHLNTGVSDKLDQSIQTAKDGFNPGSGIGETLFGLFVSAFYFFEALIMSVFSAPSLFINLGFPEWFVVPLFAPLYIIATLDLVYAATGRGMS